MIRDHALTSRLIKAANEASELLRCSLLEVRDNCSQEEFEAYRKAIAKPIANIFLGVVTPLSEAHPDLDPLKKEEETTKTRESTIKAYDSEAPLMIERLYHIEQSEGKTTGLTVQFCKPAQSQDGENDWYCIWSVSSSFGDTQLKAFGADAMESFLNAVKSAEDRVKVLAGDFPVKWKQGSGIGIIEQLNA